MHNAYHSTCTSCYNKNIFSNYFISKFSKKLALLLRKTVWVCLVNIDLYKPNSGANTQQHSSSMLWPYIEEEVHLLKHHKLLEFWLTTFIIIGSIDHYDHMLVSLGSCPVFREKMHLNISASPHISVFTMFGYACTHWKANQTPPDSTLLHVMEQKHCHI